MKKQNLILANFLIIFFFINFSILKSEDLKNHNIPDEDIRKKMDELNEKAKSDFI